MRDKAGNHYFESLKQKAISGATNAARVATADANKLGDVGEWERRAETEMRKKEIDAAQAGNNNRQDESIARSTLELQKVTIDCDQQLKMKQVEADMAPKQRSIENETRLQKLEAIKQQEKLRASQLSKTVIEAEQRVKTAQAEAEAQMKIAEAERYREVQKADAVFYRLQKEAEAELFRQMKKAEGILAVSNAQAEGLQKLAQSANPDLVKFYLGIDTGYFEKMAKNSAAAIQGLNPKINVWNTGAQDENSAATFAPFRNLVASIPPMADAIESQAGMKMPSWMPNTSGEKSDRRSVRAAS